MSQPRKQQEIANPHYDEFLGHPESSDAWRHDSRENDYVEISGSEMIHEVVSYNNKLETERQGLRREAQARPKPPKPTAKKPEPQKNKKGEEIARYDEFLGHPDFIEDMSKAVNAKEYTELEGQ